MLGPAWGAHVSRYVYRSLLIIAHTNLLASVCGICVDIED